MILPAEAAPLLAALTLVATLIVRHRLETASTQ